MWFFTHFLGHLPEPQVTIQAENGSILVLLFQSPSPFSRDQCSIHRFGSTLKKSFIFAPFVAKDLLPSLPASFTMLKAISLAHTSYRLFLRVRLLGQFGIYNSAPSETASILSERGLPCWRHVPLGDPSSLSTSQEIWLFYLVLGIFNANITNNSFYLICHVFMHSDDLDSLQE